MKNITKHFLPRLFWFHLYYNQWFKNVEGIKAFATQVMNWLMRETLSLAAKLQKQNKLLSEEIKQHTEVLNKCLKLPFISSDELPGIKSKRRLYTALIIISIMAEFGFNSFAAYVLLPIPGLVGLIAQLAFACFATFVFIKLFELLFIQLFNEPKYNSDELPERHIGKMVFYILAVIAYECGVFVLCKARGSSLEGIHGLGDLTLIGIIFGMIAPVVAGYYAYEKNRFHAAYKNTIAINKLNKIIAKKSQTIKKNEHAMEIHFKQRCQEQWAFLQEFRLYKENYNSKKGIEKEVLAGHFCETQESFITEALDRYTKSIISDESQLVIIKRDQQNGHTDLIKNVQPQV